MEAMTIPAGRDSSRHMKNGLYRAWIVGASWLFLALVLFIIGSVAFKGLPAISWEFVTSDPKDNMTAGGIGPHILGTLLLLMGAMLLQFPIGILGGLFLAEYAGRGRWVDIAKAVVTSLAGSPSVIIGLFGFAVFVQALGFKTSLLAGWLTLGMMCLPMIVITTEQAVKGVPESIIEGAVALGLTRWQTMFKVVLPYALPGIMTGVVLSTGRAVGEAPPIWLTAAFFFSTESFKFDADFYRDPVYNLTYHLVNCFQQPTIPEKITWGTAFVLMTFIFIINLGAVFVRNSARKKREA